ncbi:Carbohydrate acetyl esterase/feruloyl esterase precursor [Bremerella volcania]|uniref:Carbohydrate acetyl esterase/feruloyl esterase n=2 Tax=Bremerella volcania TaxID=2527984 RepID=A0A518C8T7_9BACT|nr:Carbohydrate acetyl esterase/feruloyl esterase precursor [Bremerella volcania]
MMRQVLPLVVLLSVLFVALFSSTGSSEETDLPAKDKFHLFLLVGQSNMAGRGKVTPDDQVKNPRVLMLDQQGKWVPAVDPMHFDKPKMVGVGLGRTFGFEVADSSPDITIGLIPCAVGGSPIRSWEPGAWDAPTKSHPYDDAMKRAHKALQSGQLKGILWHQGESDSRPEQAEVYDQKLRDLIARFRKELNAEDVPFIIGQLGKFEDNPWNEAKTQVDRAHQNIAKTDDNVLFVPADGLTHKGDKVHFNAQSYREFGKRYAKAYLEFVEESNVE